MPCYVRIWRVLDLNIWPWVRYERPNKPSAGTKFHQICRSVPGISSLLSYFCSLNHLNTVLIVSRSHEVWHQIQINLAKHSRNRYITHTILPNVVQSGTGFRFLVQLECWYFDCRHYHGKKNRVAVFEYECFLRARGVWALVSSSGSGTGVISNGRWLTRS